MTTLATPGERKALRFFWYWLIAATATSIAGNVAHALLTSAHAPAGSTINPIVAGALAVVPPIVQVGATHGVHVLVNARITGAAYKTALTITVALVVFAFTLSFQALRELAIVYAGMNSLIACLVPLVIDLSITGSTVSILALTRAHRDATVDAEADTHPHPRPLETQIAEAAMPAAAHTAAPATAEAKSHVPNESEEDAEPDQVATVEPDEEARSAEESDGDTEAPQTERIPVAAFVAAPSSEPATGPGERPQVPWVGELSLAEQIVHEGGIQIGVTKVARILHAHRQSTPPGTIARNVGCGFRTVKRIIDKVEDGQLVPA